MTFFVGYVVAAAGPVAVGALRDATGGYAFPFVALAALSAGMLTGLVPVPTAFGSTALRSVLRPPSAMS